MFSKMSNQDKRSCIQDALRLIYQIAPGIGLAEYYSIFPDNDVLNALEKPLNYKTRYIALKIAFNFLKTTDLRFKIIISPAIFIEFSDSHAFDDHNSFNKSMLYIERTAIYRNLYKITLTL